jgi:hypothetical protein
MADPIRIGNIAGMFGDRPTAAREMLEDDQVHVLTGDWLAELTMLILARTRMKRPDGGFGRTFVTQMEEVMATCLERGVKVVVNAGGLDPEGCTAAVRKVADDQGLSPSIAAITGDDLVPRMTDLLEKGQKFINLDTGEPLGHRAPMVMVANAYLGGWGIARALERGADIVITGRVTDAALVVGPAAWHHGWARTDWDRLAGAVAAGHVIECGPQATGGNYSFFDEIDDLTVPGYPWAEVHEDGSSVIGKPDGTGGEVSIGTVTSQLLYEIGSARYHNPDVTTRFDSIRLEEIAPDRVRIWGVKGEPPPPELKVAAAYPGGFRNSLMIGLTGMNTEEKAALVERQIWASSPHPRDAFASVKVTHIGGELANPTSNAAAISYLEIAVQDPDDRKVGRGWSNSMASIALGSIPGLFGVWPPGPAKPYAVYWPTSIPRSLVHNEVHIDGELDVVGETDPGDHHEAAVPAVELPDPPESSDTVLLPIGMVLGARSGDKGGNANLGVFARSPEAHGWMHRFLTVDRLKSLLPDLRHLQIERFEFPNLRALNFVIHGLLDQGVSSALRVDPQAKGLGEYLRAQLVDMPVELIES